MTNEEVKILLNDLESDRIERTVSTINTDKFCQAACAFANDLPGSKQPGFLIIGANDDGSLAGLKVTDELMRNIAGIRADGNVLPQPAITVTKYAFINM